MYTRRVGVEDMYVGVMRLPGEREVPNHLKPQPNLSTAIAVSRVHNRCYELRGFSYRLDFDGFSTFAAAIVMLENPFTFIRADLIS